MKWPENNYELTTDISSLPKWAFKWHYFFVSISPSVFVQFKTFYYATLTVGGTATSKRRYI